MTESRERSRRGGETPGGDSCKLPLMACRPARRAEPPRSNMGVLFCLVGRLTRGALLGAGSTLACRPDGLARVEIASPTDDDGAGFLAISTTSNPPGHGVGIGVVSDEGERSEELRMSCMDLKGRSPGRGLTRRLGLVTDSDAGVEALSCLHNGSGSSRKGRDCMR